MINIHPQYNKVRNFHKSAFTMLELIMVIVVLGILASLALPRMERDLRQEAGDNILSAIRYTQHLALMDNKTNPNDVYWQREYWHMRFGTYDGSKRFYTISSNVNQNTDTSGNENVNKIETALDPSNGKYMFHRSGDASLNELDESPNIFISKKYSIDTIAFTGGCSSQHIAFDHMGRPHVGIYNSSNTFDSYMTAECTWTFGFEDSGTTDLVITIQPETGYAQIVGQNAS